MISDFFRKGDLLGTLDLAASWIRSVRRLLGCLVPSGLLTAVAVPRVLLYGLLRISQFHAELPRV